MEVSGAARDAANHGARLRGRGEGLSPGRRGGVQRMTRRLGVRRAWCIRAMRPSRWRRCCYCCCCCCYCCRCPLVCGVCLGRVLVLSVASCLLPPASGLWPLAWHTGLLIPAASLTPGLVVFRSDASLIRSTPCGPLHATDPPPCSLVGPVTSSFVERAGRTGVYEGAKDHFGVLAIRIEEISSVGDDQDPGGLKRFIDDAACRRTRTGLVHGVSSVPP